jgi:hypothetical protein
MTTNLTTETRSEDRPVLAWQRMARTVLSIINEDARVKGMEPPLRLSAHSEATWVEVGRTDAPAAFKVETPHWWIPLEVDHARELADRFDGRAALDVTGVVVVVTPARLASGGLRA